MADLKKDQEAVFVAWLSEKLSAAQLSEIYMALHEIEQQAIKAKLIRKSLYENLDAALVKKIRINIEQSRFFKITHKRQMGRITSALNYLTQYATESDKKMENSTATVITEKSESLPAVEEKSSIANNANEGLSIDFSNIGNIAFTKPYELTYFGEAYKVNSWKDAYVRACGCLFEDYPDEFERFRDDCIHGSGKVWIVDSTNVYRLAVAKEVSKGYFVETNRSASDLMKNLKWIVDACRVDYENIQIRYSGKENAEDMTTDTEQVTTAVPERKYQRDDKENFFNWMRDNQKMAEATCRSYVSAIRTSEKFAVSHSFKHKDFFSADAQGAKALADELFNDSEFIELNESQHNRFRAAITKYLLYLGSDWSPTKAFTSSHHVLDYSVVQDEEIDAKPYMHVLVENFPRGYRLGSALDMKRLRRFYEEITGTTLELETEKVEYILRENGISYDGKVYSAESMLGKEMKEKLLSSIQKKFAEGKDAIYYAALFQEFSEELLDYNIYNADMLKAYLSHIADGQFVIGRSYISKEARTEADPTDEIRDCLREIGLPMQVDEICRTLSHIPADKIRWLLSVNGEFVRNSKGEYFHADSLLLTDEELENIAALIDAAIDQQEFISGNELLDAIQSKYPYTYEQNSGFSVIGWRDALKYKFGSRYSFVGNIISKAGTSLTMSDVFEDFAGVRETFTMDELMQFASDIGTPTAIYFEAVYKKSIRINQNDFVSKNQSRFQVKETDAVLDKFCAGRYLPLPAVQEFGFFPEAFRPWTEYLLEQYVAFFSEKYYLMHGNYNRNCAVGAMVKRDYHFATFDDLVTDVLAESGIQLNKKAALDYLVSNGYIARRSYANIEELLINARAKRNQKENQ